MEFLNLLTAWHTQFSGQEIFIHHNSSLEKLGTSWRRFAILEAVACTIATFPVATVPPVALVHPSTKSDLPAAEPVQEIAPVACAPVPVQCCSSPIFSLDFIAHQVVLHTLPIIISLWPVLIILPHSFKFSLINSITSGSSVNTGHVLHTRSIQRTDPVVLFIFRAS